MNTPVPPPSEIRLHLKSRTLELVYPDGNFELSAEFLRVHSPSAEVARPRRRQRGVANRQAACGDRGGGAGRQLRPQNPV